MTSVNAFLVVGNEVVLFDSGEHTEKSYEALCSGLRDAGIGLKDLDRIIISHAHVDHIGMADRISQESGAKVWVSEKVLPWAVNPDKLWEQRSALMLPTMLDYFDPDTREFVKTSYDSLMGGLGKVWDPIDEDRLVVFDSEGTMSIDNTDWSVMYMPGHSLTQSTFYHPPSQSYISADMILKVIPTPVIEMSEDDPKQRNIGITDMLKSFDRARELDIKSTYPGHYEIMADPTDLIVHQINRLNKRKDNCYDLIKSGQHRMIDLFTTMYQGRMNMPGLLMLIGYLDLLNKEGRIVSTMRDGFVHLDSVS